MNILSQKISLRRILGMIAGVVIIGIGIAVFKFSHLGNDSISALNLRLAELVGLPFSIENVLMNLFLFIPQLIWGRRYIGLGTIINSFCIGFIVTFTNDALVRVFGKADTLPVQLVWVERLGQTLIAVGIALLLLPGSAVLPVGLVVIGLGCAPIYPCIIHETPANFGKNLSMAMTGIQMAAAYVGVTLLSPFFGVLAQNITMQLYPWALLAMLLLMVVLSEQLHKKTAASRAGKV